MRTIPILTLVLLIASAEGSLGPQDETSREIMWSKLDLSHDSLDALVLEDFEALEAYAADLETLADATAIHILPDDMKPRVVAFKNAASALKDAAMRQNVEAGALAYWDLTLRCIGCHQRLGVTPE